MDLSQAVNVNDFISFLLGLLASGTAIYKYCEKRQLIPQALQKEIQSIIIEAEEYGEKGYTDQQAQALGELIIRSVAEINQATKTAAAGK